MQRESSKKNLSQQPEREENNVVELSGTVFKALAVLDLVIGSVHPSSAADITDKLKMPRPTTNRLIANLVKLGYLQRDAGNGQLIEGDRLLRLSLSVLTHAAQRPPRHQLLQALAERTQETCNVGTIVDGQVRYLDRVEAQWPLSLRLDPGSMVPLHCSALGKVLLGHMEAAQRDKYLLTLNLKRYTSNTIVDVSALKEELDRIAQDGYSLDNEEYFNGVVGMAVPIPNGGRVPVLALAVAAPSARVNVQELKENLTLLREVAEKLAVSY